MIIPEMAFIFLTFCTHNKNCYLGKITGDWAVNDAIEYKLALSKAGQMVITVIEDLPARYENVSIESYCIMPNHVHMMVAVLDDSSSMEQRAQRSLISKIVGYVKMNSAKQIRMDNPFIPGVWQRG